MSKWKKCCCVDSNCLMRTLMTTKTRFGFPRLYTTANGDTGFKVSRLRYFEKQIDFHVQDDTVYADARPSLSDTADYHCTLEIIERKTGKLTIDESTSEASLSDQRSGAVSAMNSLFDEFKDEDEGTHTSSGTIFGNPWSRTVEVDWTMEGLDIVGFSITDTYVETGSVGPPLTTYTRTRVITASVTMASLYADSAYKDDIEDLLTNYPTDGGSTNGIAGVPDNYIVLIEWNESDLNGGIGAVVPDASTLAAYTTLDDPETIVTILASDPTTWFAGFGYWWQHPGGSDSNGEDPGVDPPFSVYHCEFADDDSMSWDTRTDPQAWDDQASEMVQINTPHPVCAKWSWENAAGFVEETCQVIPSVGGKVIFMTPHPIAESDTNIKVASWTAGLFTAPGALTAGDCPCA